MHALRHAHELLVPGGMMVDVHPVTEEQVESGRAAIGVINDPDFISRDLPNAEARLKAAIHDGLYILEAEMEFDMLQHFDHADDLLAAREERLAAQPELVRRIRAATTPLRLREHVVLRRLRAKPT